MKTKKQLYHLMLMTGIAFLLSFALTACGDNGDPDPEIPQEEQTTDYKKAIVGIWTEVNSSASHQLYVVRADGTGTFYQNYDDAYADLITLPFNYRFTSDDAFTVEVQRENSKESLSFTISSYNESEGTIYLIGNDGNELYLRRLTEMPEVVCRATMRAEAEVEEVDFLASQMNIYLYDYDDEMPTVSTDADWAVATIHSDWFHDNVTDNGKEAVRHLVILEYGKNTGAARQCTVTFTKESGEKATVVIRQKAFVSLTASGGAIVNIDGTPYEGWTLNSGASSDCCYAWVRSYDDQPIYVSNSASWFWYNRKELKNSDENCTEYMYWFSKSQNTGYNRSCTVTLYKADGTSVTLAAVQSGPLGEPSGGGGNSGGSGGGSSGSTSNYNISSTSVYAVWVSTTPGSNYSSATRNSWYKWVSKTDGKVILSKSSTNTAYWVGVASKNSDKKQGNYDVSTYTYRVADYSPVGGNYFYYFN